MLIESTVWITGRAITHTCVNLLLAALAAFTAVPSTALAGERGNPTEASVSGAVDALRKAAGAPIDVELSPTTGLVAFVSTRAGHPIHVGGTSPEEVGRRFLDFYGAAFDVTDASQLQLIRLQGPDEVGMSHVRLQQIHRGTPVRGAELTIHLRGPNVVTVQAKTVPRHQLMDPIPTLTGSDAVLSAQEFLVGEFGVTDAALSTPRLELFNLGLLSGGRTPTQLAWFIEATTSDSREFIWVDAHTGNVLQHFDVLAEAVLPQIYDYTDPAHPLLVTEFPSGDVSTDRAYDYALDTYYYFLIAHGRDSWDGAGAPLIVNVHYPCSGFTASWGGHVDYCEGQPVTDDVIGHEITHGVSLADANLSSYPNESGAINEGYAYLFGEAIDLTNGRDAGPSVRWGWAEDMAGTPLVDMMNPVVSGLAGKVSDPQLVCGGADPEHKNAWVLTHAFALMVDGGTYNGTTVAGIGLEKAAKVHYRALSVYLFEAADFLDNARALVLSCRDLVGSGGMTSADCVEVTQALDAVEMYLPLCPEYILTANDQHTVDVRLSRGDGSFFPPVPVGEDLGLNYAEFAIDGTGFFAATQENPSRLFWFQRTGRAVFEQTFVKTLDPDPKLSPDYGLGLTTGLHPLLRAHFLLENINVGFVDETSHLLGYWIAQGNLCLTTSGLGCERASNQSREAFNFASIFTGSTLSKSGNLADVDDDGFQDMLASTEGADGSDVYLLRGGRDTSVVPYRFFFAPPQHVFRTDQLQASSMALGDFNNDGVADALVGQDDDGDPGAALLFPGKGDGGFQPCGREAFDVVTDIESGTDQPGAGLFLAYDADKDGVLDVISAYRRKGVDDPDEGSRLVFLRGRGLGRFDAPVTIEENIIFRTAFTTPASSPDDLSPGPETVAQSEPQQACINALNTSALGVVKAQNQSVRRCLKDVASGKQTDVGACLAGIDTSNAERKTTNTNARKCAGDGLPDFAYACPTTINAGAKDSSLGAVGLVFGAMPVVANKKADKVGAACQAEVAKRQFKLQETWLAEANKASKSALDTTKSTPGAANPTELATAIDLAVAASSRIANAEAGVTDGIAKKCAGADIATLFHCGGATDSTALGTCVLQAAERSACLSLELSDALALSCRGDL